MRRSGVFRETWRVKSLVDLSLKMSDTGGGGGVCRVGIRKSCRTQMAFNNNNNRSESDISLSLSLQRNKSTQVETG